MNTGLRFRLSVMMFLQYAIWGAWLPLLWPYLSGARGFDANEIGYMFSVGAVGALVAPFIAGQIADRYFPTQVFLGISHLVGAVLIWQLANLETFTAFMIFSIIYSIAYAPTMPLTNSLAFHHIEDRDRDFGSIRLWGTIGWVVVGIGMGNWLAAEHTISDEAAAAAAVNTHVMDAGQRKKLLSLEEITTSDDETVVGTVTARNGDQWTITLPPAGDGEAVKEPVTITGKSARPLYMSLAAEGQATTLKDLLDSAERGETEGAIFNEGNSPKLWSKKTIQAEVGAGHSRGMSDAFKLSAILGAIMGVFCFFLPHTPPSKGREKNAVFEALGEVKFQPLLTLFLMAIPVSCIHQFYFVHTAPFLGNYQLGVAKSLNSVFGVGGGGLMTIGQISEILVLAAIPLFARLFSRKQLLLIGLLAYAARMALFAYVDPLAANGIDPIYILIAGVALHGICFGFFIFLAFMIVDEETTPDVRASAQSLFNFVVVGIGIIVGSLIAGMVATWATQSTALGESLNYTKLFGVPMWASLACFVVTLLIYPSKSPKRGVSAS